MIAGQYDFPVIGGNTLPIALRFPKFDATGSQFRFVCVSPGGERVERDSADGSLTVVVEPDPDHSGFMRSRLDTALSPADTRRLDIGRVNAFELERRIDATEITILAGFVVITSGVNDDE